jgi:hypothetical protein
MYKEKKKCREKTKQKRKQGVTLLYNALLIPNSQQ